MDTQDMKRFSRAVLGDSGAGVEGLLTPQTASNMRVYRTNLMGSLREVLKDTHPVTARLLGESNFRLFVWRYVNLHPPSGYGLDASGGDFAAFLAVQPEIAQNQPALAYFARLDRALHHPSAPDVSHLELPGNILEHYQSVQTTGQLAQKPPGPLQSFQIER